MPTKHLENSQVFRFKRENSNLVLTYATDNSHESVKFRRGVIISGSENFASPFLSVYGTINSYNYDSTPGLRIQANGDYGDAAISFKADTPGSWTIGVEEPDDKFHIQNGARLDNGTKVLTIDSSNRVGIGDDSPSYKLDVNGSIRTTSNLYVNDDIYMTDKVKWEDKATSGATQNVMEIKMDGDGRADLCYWERDSNNKCWIGYDGNDSNPPHFTVKLYNGSADKYWKFHDSGVFETSGLNNTSDARLKTNIRSLKTPLEKVCSLRGIKFDWKESTSGLNQIGLLAQEVEKVIPEVVRTAPEKAEDGETLSQVDNQKSISYIGLVPYLIESVKELTAKVKDLEKRLGDK